MSDYKFHTLDIEAGVACITWDRPPVNFFNIELMKELTGILKTVSTDQAVRVVTLGGSGKFFSAGVEVSEHMGDNVDEMIRVFHGLFHAMNAVPQPLIALVNGQALGGGAEVVLGCDMAMAHEKSKWGQPEIKVGVYPPIALVYLPRKIGQMKAMELVLGGAVISAHEAERLGIYNRVVPLERFSEESQAFVATFASLSGPVLAITKRAMQAALGGAEQFARALEPVERIYLDELMKTTDAQEGLRSFMDKRDPVWTHQ